MILDEFVAFQVVAASLCSLIVGWFFGVVYEINRSNEEYARKAAEDKQQKMWNEYLNVLKGGQHER